MIKRVGITEYPVLQSKEWYLSAAAYWQKAAYDWSERMRLSLHLEHYEQFAYAEMRSEDAAYQSAHFYECARVASFAGRVPYTGFDW